ncbi:MAG: hypothetical protein K1X92_09425 [Bacteroidia bacterium]|nr:hypothetical protein [Bacteroidia bacterium]
MKKVFILGVIIAFVSACGSLPEPKNSVSSLFSAFKRQSREVPLGQNSQMRADFRKYLATKYQDTTVLYYDFSDMAIGNLNSDDLQDFSMQYSAPPAGDKDCIQCWEIYHTFFLKDGSRYRFIEEMQVGAGSGGNGSYYRIDSLANGNIHRTFYTIEEGDDLQSDNKDVLQFLNGKIIRPLEKISM